MSHQIYFTQRIKNYSKVIISWHQKTIFEITIVFGILFMEIWETFEVKNIVSFNYKLQMQGSVKLTSLGF